MESQLDKYKKEFLEIENSVGRFALESGLKMKGYTGCENREQVFHEAYISQFEAYMKLVYLRDSALRSNEISQSQKEALNETLTEYILKHQRNLNLGLNIALCQKRV